MALLEARNLVVHFGGITALDDLSIVVDGAGITGLIGPNGAGKSTCFNCLTGLQRPASGAVLLDGEVVTARPPHERARRGMGRTFQQLETFRSMTVHENLVVAAEAQERGSVLADLFDLPARRRREREAVARADALIGRFALGPIADRMVGDLSLGQERIVELARALAAEPRILLLDEPSSGLDTAESEVFESHLVDLAAEGLAILLVEHDMALVMSICDRLYVLDFGQLIAEGPAETVRRDPVVIAAYLGEELPDSSLTS